MESFGEVESLYREVYAVSQSMLVAANNQEWDALILLEQTRSDLIFKLQTSDDLIPEKQEQRDILIELIRAIQKCDEVMRPLILTWMTELRSIIESAGNERRLGRQYGVS